MADNDIVTFLMPDGTEVSNDPRWLAKQNAAEYASELLESVPNTGKAGIPDEDMNAQLGNKMAPLQSGQPGVGENATVTMDEAVAGRFTGQDIQLADAQVARDNEFDAENPARPAPENPDSNEAVLAAREKAAKAAAALADAGEEPGDPDEPYEKWTAKQLKAEALRRNADRPPDQQLSFEGVKKKADLAALLDADNERHS
jgi:hypothetical protein